MIVNRIAGVLLLAAGILGFFTVADDLRHKGELVGVASVTLAGIILLAGSIEHRLMRVVSSRWIALGMLSGIIIGAGLDSMLLGEAIGITAGSIAGFSHSRRHRLEA